MPLTIFDAENAFTAGAMNFDEWLEKFEAGWYEPLGRTMLATLIQSLPPEVVQQLQARKPEAFQAILDMIGKRG
jgi:hypothetical protein